MGALRQILREMHRRGLWQVLGLYLAGSWALFEGADFTTRFVGLPEWTPAFALVLLLIGLPVVAVTAYVQEGLPGLRGGYRDEVDPNVLEGLTPEQVHRVPEPRLLRRQRIFTWRNAVLGGVGAAALLVASVIAYFGMWAAGVGPMGNLVAQGLVSPGDVVVLTDFRDATGEGMGEVVTEALLVDLSQAGMLRVVQDPERRTGDPATDPAREAAARAGFKAVLDGEVASVGAGYHVTAALREARSGRTLASFRSVAGAPDDVIGAIDRLARDIRERSGESLLELNAGLPLQAVSTASLEALRLYAQAGGALRRGEEARAVELLNASVVLDPGFALAWRRLAEVHAATGLAPELMVEAATRAYQHRDRLTERDQHLAEAFYNDRVARDG